MTEATDIRFTEAELDAIADRISKRILLNLTPEKHQEHHRWTSGKIDSERKTKTSVRHIVEGVIGTVATAAIVGFVVWLGHIVLLSWGVGR